jgi:rSAM/selenodomain-associated transferase 1
VKNALIIFAKSPEGGDVKTRLAGHLTDAERLELYTALLEATIGELKDIENVDTFISYTPPEGGEYFREFGLGMFPQPGGDIGRRMHRALDKVLEDGYQKAVLVGVDIPGLSARIILKAFELLSDSDIVFGPARDGGYYLVGLKVPEEKIFKDIEWSTENTLRQSIQKAEASGKSVACTEELSDIDTAEDIKKLLHEKDA